MKNSREREKKRWWRKIASLFNELQIKPEYACNLKFRKEKLSFVNHHQIQSRVWIRIQLEPKSPLSSSTSPLQQCFCRKDNMKSENSRCQYPCKSLLFSFFCSHILDFNSKAQNSTHIKIQYHIENRFVPTGPDPLLIQINTDLFSLSAFTLWIQPLGSLSSQTGRVCF